MILVCLNVYSIKCFLEGEYSMTVPKNHSWCVTVKSKTANERRGFRDAAPDVQYFDKCVDHLQYKKKSKVSVDKFRSIPPNGTKCDFIFLYMLTTKLVL